MKIPLDKLDYIIRLIDVKLHRANNVYIIEECNEQIEAFEKEYNVSIVNEYLCDNESDNS